MTVIAYLWPLVTLVAALIVTVLLFKAYDATNFGGLLVLIGATLLNVANALISAAFTFSVHGAGKNASTHTLAFYGLLSSVQLGIHCLVLGLTTLGMALLLQEFVKISRERKQPPL